MDLDNVAGNAVGGGAAPAAGGGGVGGFLFGAAGETFSIYSKYNLVVNYPCSCYDN